MILKNIFVVKNSWILYILVIKIEHKLFLLWISSYIVDYLSFYLQFLLSFDTNMFHDKDYLWFWLKNTYITLGMNNPLITDIRKKERFFRKVNITFIKIDVLMLLFSNKNKVTWRVSTTEHLLLSKCSYENMYYESLY